MIESGTNENLQLPEINYLLIKSVIDFCTSKYSFVMAIHYTEPHLYDAFEEGALPISTVLFPHR